MRDLVCDYTVKDAPTNKAMKRKRKASQTDAPEADDDSITTASLSKIANDIRFPERVLQTYQQEAVGCKSTLIFADSLCRVYDIVRTLNMAGVKTG